MASNFAVNNIRDFEFIIQEWLPTEGFLTTRSLQTIIPRMILNQS